ncbi:MAG: DUF6056 family protein [Bacilli bacterium]|nr:DUF6056 family protein [Bacilli bacterium]
MKLIINIFNFIKKYKYYIYFFVLVYVISILTPYTGDDYGNYMPDTNIISAAKTAIKNYFTYESRVFSRFLINILVYHKWLWNIVNAASMLLMYWCFNKCANKNNNKYIYMLSMILILLVPGSMFGQVYAWPTGGCTYLIPASLILFYITYIFNYKINKKIIVVLLGILNFIIPMFVDNFGVGLIIANIIFLTYFFKDKNKSKKILFFTLLSIISILIVYFSPGSANRLATTDEFSNLSILGKIIFNFDNFFNYTFYAVPFTLILMMIINIYVINKLIKQNVIFKTILILIFCFGPLYTSFIGLYMYNPLSEYIASLDFFWLEKNMFLDTYVGHLYYFIFALFFIYSIYYIYKNDCLKYIALVIIGVSTNFIMFLSPTWGFRTTFFTNIMILLVCLILISKIIEVENYFNTDSKIIIKTIYFIMIIYLLTSFILISKFEQNRLFDIKNQYNNGYCDIYIKSAPFRILWNYNPFTDWHLYTYKGYLKNRNIINSELVDIHVEYSKDIFYRR